MESSEVASAVGGGPHHGEGLSGAGLAVGEEADVKSVQYRLHELLYLVVHLLLALVVLEDACRLDRECARSFAFLTRATTGNVFKQRRADSGTIHRSNALSRARVREAFQNTLHIVHTHSRELRTPVYAHKALKTPDVESYVSREPCLLRRWNSAIELPGLLLAPRRDRDLALVRKRDAFRQPLAALRHTKLSVSRGGARRHAKSLSLSLSLSLSRRKTALFFTQATKTNAQVTSE